MKTLAMFVTYGTTVNRKGIQVWMEELHFAWHVAAKLLVRSYKILHKLPEVDGFYIS
jgi:hypothetical protein